MAEKSNGFNMVAGKTATVVVMIRYRSRDWSSDQQKAFYEEWVHCAEEWAKGHKNAWQGSRYFIHDDPPIGVSYYMHVFDSEISALEYKFSDIHKNMIKGLDSLSYDIEVETNLQFVYKDGHHPGGG